MTGGQMRRKEFMAEVLRACQAALPPACGNAHTRSTMNLLKIHFNENFRIHYELMFSAQNGIIEVGLHFEDGPESTAKLLEFFDMRVVEIKHQLGPEFELERWTKSWGHFFEVWPIEPLTVSFARRLGARLAEIIGVVQPYLDEAFDQGFVSATPRPSTLRRRFRR
jgi:hypothetical protein